MGKTKHEKKFDRNVEISAPILDQETINKIHSPPQNQKRDIRHGGFKALLSDLNSQDSTDELTPITDNHLPSYIGISCAVSGYSNYSSYGRKPLEESSTRAETKAHKLAMTSSKQTNRSQTNSPLAVRTEQHNIHHVTVDKSNINSVDQERKELTEKLTASAAERRQSPSPIPPTEDDRHHGAYVGARYFPMPEPSKVVNKHIPLLGIDDDMDPDEIVDDDYNKVEKKIASLYGENFVLDWKEAMSHKSKKELHDDKQTANKSPQNLKEMINLKPTPPKAPQPDEPIQVDIPTPNAKVLANVEKQFLNRLLSDENPPTPKSPTPQSLSPTSPKLMSPVKTVTPQKQSVEDIQYNSRTSISSPTRGVREPSPGTTDITQEIVDPISSAGDELVEHAEKESVNDLVDQGAFSPHSSEENTQNDLISGIADEPLIAFENTTRAETNLHYDEDLHEEQDPHQETDYLTKNEISENHQDHLLTDQTFVEDVLADEEVQAAVSAKAQRSRSSSEASQEQAKSPESQISSSTVERVPLEKQHQHDHDGDVHTEDHIEYQIQSQTPPINNESSPVKIPERLGEDSILVATEEAISKESDNLVSFSPEPDALISETNNNLEEQLKQTQDCIDSLPEELVSGEDLTKAEIVAESEVKQGDVAADLNEEKKDGHYFLNLLKEEESFIMERVRLAEQVLAEHGDGMDEERLGRIHSAIGKANLLINKKCNQFRELCEKSLTGDANDQYKVLDDDLAGFWDMISIQIVDVRKSLENV